MNNKSYGPCWAQDHSMKVGVMDCRAKGISTTDGAWKACDFAPKVDILRTPTKDPSPGKQSHDSPGFRSLPSPRLQRYHQSASART